MSVAKSPGAWLKGDYLRRIYTRLLPELLGPPHFSEEVLRENDEVGVATGVAWTSAWATRCSSRST